MEMDYSDQTAIINIANDIKEEEVLPDQFDPDSSQIIQDPRVKEQKVREHKSIVLKMLQKFLPSLYAKLPLDKLDKKDKKPKKVQKIEINQEGKTRKKFQFKIVHLLILLAIGYLVLDEFFPEEAPQPVAKTKKAPKKKVVKKELVEKEAPVEVKEINTDTKEASVPSQAVEAVEKTEIFDTDSTEKEIKKIEEKIAEDEKKEEVAVEPKEKTQVEEIEEAFTSSTEEKTAGPDFVEIEESENSQTDLNTNDVIEKTTEASTSTTESSSEVAMEESLTEKRVAKSEEIVNEEIKDDIISDDLINNFDTELETDITKGVLESLEEKIASKKSEDEVSEVIRGDYSPSPDYTFGGRGLVYNCRGKHWACVDYKAFNKCRSNFNWNKYNSKETECYPLSLYDTNVDCENVQQSKVNNSAKTEFCL